jgi:hypothetical protein
VAQFGPSELERIAAVPLLGVAGSVEKAATDAALQAAKAAAEQASTPSTLERLLVHVDNARVRVDQNGLTKNQLESIKLNPRLEAPHKGERIDTFAKETVAEDEYLAHLKITPRFQYGPDFYDPINNVWYDITTLKQWLRHEKSVRRFTWCDVGRNAKRRRP